MTFYFEIETPRLLRKPLREGFLNECKTEAELRRVIAKYRPKARIIYFVEVEKKTKKLNCPFSKPDSCPSLSEKNSTSDQK
jgi:hypothetical protein